MVLSAGCRHRTLLSLPTPAFAPGSSEVAVGCFVLFCFLVFFILLSTVSPNCTFFLVPCSCVLFRCLRRVRPDTNTAAEGPRAQAGLPGVSDGYNFCLFLLSGDIKIIKQIDSLTGMAFCQRAKYLSKICGISNKSVSPLKIFRIHL